MGIVPFIVIQSHLIWYQSKDCVEVSIINLYRVSYHFQVTVDYWSHFAFDRGTSL